MIIMKIVTKKIEKEFYICDNCKKEHGTPDNIKKCTLCEKEGCLKCMSFNFWFDNMTFYKHHKECGSKEQREEHKKLKNHERVVGFSYAN